MNNDAGRALGAIPEVFSLRHIDLIFVFALCVTTVAACAGDPGHTPILTCEAAAGIEPDCRFGNPEDIVVAPRGRQLIVSQMASPDGSRAGNLIALEPPAGAIEVLFPSDDASAEPTPDWGDSDCPRFDNPQAIAPHGIDIEQRDDGRHELFVVNHGERESVELFEVIDDGSAVKLQYRGCVLAQGDMQFNDVVGHADGSFWVSHTYSHGMNITLGVLRMQWTSYAPGKVYAWSHSGGYREIGGSAAKYANGVEKSEDGSVLYVNSYFGDEVIKVNVADGERIGSVSVPSPDNLSWSPSGELLVAGHDATFAETMKCLELTEGNCGIRFVVAAIDTNAMTARTIIENVGAPMGAATVAVAHGEYVYLGTFSGDRIARVSSDLLQR